MGFVTKRRGGETYPTSPGAAGGGAAVAALQNRNIASLSILTTPFAPSGNNIAAIIFTPKVSGVIQVSASLDLQNAAAPDTFTAELAVVPGTGLNITGGSATVGGWRVGSTVAPVVGGALGSPVLLLTASWDAADDEEFSLLMFGLTSPPLPVGVPVAIAVILGQSGANALSLLAFTNISVYELP